MDKLDQDSSTHQGQVNQGRSQPLRGLPALIFASRWLQLPLYLGLIVAQAVYVVLFIQELSHLVPVLWDPNALDNTASALGIVARSKEIVVMLMVLDRKSTRLNSSHVSESRMPSSA